MVKKINNDFQWLLHIAFLRKIINEHSDNYLEYLNETGKEIGIRLVDDFCARFKVYEKIKDSEIEKYLTIFLDFYFDKEILVDKNTIIFKNDILAHHKNPGVYLFKEILTQVFSNLNDNVQFLILNEKLEFNLKN